MSRTKRSALNLIVGLLLSGGLLVLGFLTTPFLLRWLGADTLGAFRAASDWTGYVSMLDLGLGGALPILFAEAHSRRDVAAITSILASGVRAYFRAYAFIIAAGIVLVVLIPYLVHVTPELTFGLRLGVVLGLLPLVWQPAGVFRTLAEASQRGYVVSALALLQSFQVAILSLTFAWLGLGLPGQFLAVLLGSLVLHAGLALSCRDFLPAFWRALRAPPEKDPHRAALGSLQLRSFSQNLCGRLSMLTDNIIICAFFGPAEVVTFFVSQRFVGALAAQFALIGSQTWAALAELHHQGHHRLFNERLIELTLLSAVLALSGAVPTAVFSAAFVRLWVGEAYYGGDLIPLLAAGNAFLLTILSLWSLVIIGCGFLSLLLRVQFIQTVVNVLLSILATYWCGLPGPLLGTFIAMTGVYLWWWPLLLRDCFGTPLVPLASALVRPLVVALPFAVALRFYASAYPPTGWVSLGSSLACSALLYLALAWFLALRAQERRAWSLRIGSLLLRRAG